MKKYLFILILFLCGTASILSAQSIDIQGVVVDENGESVVGVAVLVAGSKTAAITDVAGKYAIRAGKSDILVFSALGYEELREDIAGRNRIDVSLKSSIMTLDDAVVIGYGTQKKSDLTGSVSVVSTDDINSPAFNSADQALQGRVAGVDIVSGGGEPGAESTIRVRGTRSITAGNDPLIVVDGVLEEHQHSQRCLVYGYLWCPWCQWGHSGDDKRRREATAKDCFYDFFRSFGASKKTRCDGCLTICPLA